MTDHLNDTSVQSHLGNVRPKPAAYDVNDPEEVMRLYRECSGYLRTCKRDHHGTDWEGRQHAIDGLEKLMSLTRLLRRLGATQKRKATR